MINGPAMILEKPDYRVVERSMLGVRYDLPSPLASFEDPSNLYTSTAEGDFSFARQMTEIQSLPDHLKPEAFAFTYKSAIPIADAIRGYFDEIGRNCPPLMYVIARHSSNTDQESPEFQREVERLAPQVEDLDRVCIIDQFVSTRRTLLLGGELLKASGVTGWYMPGVWYLNAHLESQHLTSLSSRHSDFMRSIGQATARQRRN